MICQKGLVMIVFPKAKINIGLKITGKRPDGFHNIETFLCPMELYDALELVVTAEDSAGDNLTVTGIMREDDPDNNLVMKAVKLMRQSFNFPALDIHLHKTIPPGSGLGGGSSDAAAMLRALNKKFGFGLTSEELRSFAGLLGSDITFFIDSTPSFAEGTGNILSEFHLNLTGCRFVILFPDISVSTAEAYARCVPAAAGSPSLRESLALPVSQWRDRVSNDFEEIIFSSYPQLDELKRGLYEAGALYASMSGSGSALYGIFTEEPQLSPRLEQYRLSLSRMI